MGIRPKNTPTPVHKTDLLCDTGYQKCRQLPTGLLVHWVIDVISLAVGVETAESNAGTFSPFVSVYALHPAFFYMSPPTLQLCEESNSLLSLTALSSCILLHQSTSSPSFKTPKSLNSSSSFSLRIFGSSWLLRFLSCPRTVTPAVIDCLPLSLSVCCHCFSPPSLMLPPLSWFCVTGHHWFDPQRLLPRRVTAVIRAERLWDAYYRSPAGQLETENHEVRKA